MVLPATNLPSAMSLLGSVSHTTVFLQLLSNFINSCNICQIKVILLTRSQILNYLFGKNVHQQEAKLQSNCHLLKLSFLKKRFPLLNNNNHFLLTCFVLLLQISRHKTQVLNLEKFQKNIVELGRKQEISLELDIERTRKDDIHHAYGLRVTGIASLIVSLNRFFCPTLAWEKVLINNNSIEMFLIDIFFGFSKVSSSSPKIPGDVDKFFTVFFILIQTWRKFKKCMKIKKELKEEKSNSVFGWVAVVVVRH